MKNFIKAIEIYYVFIAMNLMEKQLNKNFTFDAKTHRILQY